MTRSIRFEEIMSRILCSAACALFAFSLVLQLTEFITPKAEPMKVAAITRHVRLIPVYLDDTVVVEQPSVLRLYKKQAPAAYRREFTDFLEPGLVRYEKEWEPAEEDVIALAQTLWGECRGCSYLQKAAVCWCVFNRVDSSVFPDTIIGVVSQPSQFFGYSTSFPVTDELYEIAYNCIVDWHNGENRVLDPEFLYFHGNGRINIFTTQYGGDGGRRWSEE